MKQQPVSYTHLDVYKRQHLDLAGELVFRLRNGEENPLRDIYLPAFRKGGFDLIVSSIYLQNHELPEGGLRAALEQIVVLKEQIRKNPEFLEIRSVEDLDRCLEDHLIGIILYMEGLDCIGSDVRLLTAQMCIRDSSMADGASGSGVLTGKDTTIMRICGKDFPISRS